MGNGHFPFSRPLWQQRFSSLTYRSEKGRFSGRVSPGHSGRDIESLRPWHEARFHNYRLAPIACFLESKRNWPICGRILPVGWNRCPAYLAQAGACLPGTSLAARSKPAQNPSSPNPISFRQIWFPVKGRIGRPGRPDAGLNERLRGTNYGRSRDTDHCDRNFS
jgi:hypothetical protein